MSHLSTLVADNPEIADALDATGLNGGVRRMIRTGKSKGKPFPRGITDSLQHLVESPAMVPYRDQVVSAILSDLFGFLLVAPASDDPGMKLDENAKAWAAQMSLRIKTLRTAMAHELHERICSLEAAAKAYDIYAKGDQP